MNDDRKSLWPWIAALLIGLPVMYVASFGPVYMLVVSPVAYVDEGHLGIVSSGQVEPVYISRNSGIGECANRGLQWAFIPVNWLDRRIRASIWEIPQMAGPERALSWRELTRHRRIANRTARKPR
jgi:hypothetical protein